MTWTMKIDPVATVDFVNTIDEAYLQRNRANFLADPADREPRETDLQIRAAVKVAKALATSGSIATTDLMLSATLKGGPNGITVSVATDAPKAEAPVEAVPVAAVVEAPARKRK